MKYRWIRGVFAELKGTGKLDVYWTSVQRTWTQPARCYQLGARAETPGGPDGGWLDLRSRERRGLRAQEGETERRSIDARLLPRFDRRRERVGVDGGRGGGRPGDGVRE